MPKNRVTYVYFNKEENRVTTVSAPHGAHSRGYAHATDSVQVLTVETRTPYLLKAADGWFAG